MICILSTAYLLFFSVQHSLAQKTHATDIRCRRLRSLSNSEDRVFSQYSEDGVLIALLDILGIDDKRKFFVEFGESGIECNTRILTRKNGI